MENREITEAAFLDELEKIGGWGDTLKTFGQGVSKGWARGGTALSMGNMAGAMGQKGGAGMLGGLRAIPGVVSQAAPLAEHIGTVGRLAAKPAAIAAGGLYAGSKILGNRQQQRY